MALRTTLSAASGALFELSTILLTTPNDSASQTPSEAITSTPPALRERDRLHVGFRSHPTAAVSIADRARVTHAAREAAERPRRLAIDRQVAELAALGAHALALLRALLETVTLCELLHA
jgi:hypothetical protein